MTRSNHHRILSVLGIVLLLGVGAVGLRTFMERNRQDELIKPPSSSTPPESSTTAPSNIQIPTFDKNKYSTSEPGSIWWVVNKKRPLPDGYVPPDLGVPDVRLRLNASEQQMQFSKSATPALKEMFAAAAADDITLVFGSGYRSEALQRQFYNSYVAKDGQEAADRYSARPGTSEHQTGLAFDATSVSQKCHLEICYADMPEGKWIAANAYKYGFIVRYVDGKENITGYQYEPWHLRYIGQELATEMRNTDVQTLEEFFGLPAAPSY